MSRLTAGYLPLHLRGGARLGDGDPVGGELRFGGALGAPAQARPGGVPPVFGVHGPGEVGGEDPADAERVLPDGADRFGPQEHLQDGEPFGPVGDAPGLLDPAALVPVAAAVVGEGVPELPVRHREMTADGEAVGDGPVQRAAGEERVDPALGQADAGGGLRVGAPAGQVGGGGGEVGLAGGARVDGEEGGVVGGPDLGEPAQSARLVHRFGGGGGEHPGGVDDEHPVRGGVEERRVGTGVDLGPVLRQVQLVPREYVEVRGPVMRPSWPRTALSMTLGAIQVPMRPSLRAVP